MSLLSVPLLYLESYELCQQKNLVNFSKNMVVLVCFFCQLMASMRKSEKFKHYYFLIGFFVICHKIINTISVTTKNNFFYSDFMSD